MRSGYDSFPAQVGWSGAYRIPDRWAARMGGMTGCLALADGAGPDTEWVRRAALRIAHRGPDDEGYFADPDVALAFKRLGASTFRSAAASRRTPPTAATGWS